MKHFKLKNKQFESLFMSCWYLRTACYSARRKTCLQPSLNVIPANVCCYLSISNNCITWRSLCICFLLDHITHHTSTTRQSWAFRRTICIRTAEENVGLSRAPARFFEWIRRQKGFWAALNSELSGHWRRRLCPMTCNRHCHRLLTTTAFYPSVGIADG